jgi:hypothetical protein
MSSTPFFWLVQDDYDWQDLKTNIKSKGINLNENPIDFPLKATTGIVFYSGVLPAWVPLKNTNFYKILLISSKEALFEFNNLLEFDEVIFNTDLQENFLKQFIPLLLIKSDAKSQSNKTKQLQIQNLKSAERDLQTRIEELKELQHEASLNANTLNIELQKSHSLLKFILLLSKEMEINKILGQVWKDLIQIRGTLNIFLIQTSDNNFCRFYYKQQGMFIYKLTQFEGLPDEASFNNHGWAKIVSEIQRKPTANFFTFPLHKYFKNKLTCKKTILLVEQQYKNEDNAATIKFISERLPFISMAIEKSRMSDELINKNRLWENTFDGITDPLMIVDSNYNIIRSNQAFTVTVPAKICYSSFTSAKKPCENCPLPKNQKDQSEVSDIHSNELYFNNKVYLVNSYPLSKSYSNKYFINHYSEVSKERELLVKTLHVEKMRSLDSFADQLSTNLRKPLQAISESLRQHPEVLTCPDAIEIKKAVLRSELVLNNLTEFAKGNPSLNVVAVDRLIEGTLPFYKSLARKHKIYMHLHASGVQAKISPSLFQQVIFNLVNNACQAMINPGSVTISSSKSKLNDLQGIRIEIVDTGPGIPEHLRENIFKSAFTTKDIKKGTGLGLKICQFIINSFQGFIEYQPLSNGSKFWIWIPEEINASI